MSSFEPSAHSSSAVHGDGLVNARDSRHPRPLPLLLPPQAENDDEELEDPSFRDSPRESLSAKGRDFLLRDSPVSLERMQSLEEEYGKKKMELLSELERDEELFSPCGPEIVPPLTLGEEEPRKSAGRERTQDTLKSIFGTSFEDEAAKRDDVLDTNLDVIPGDVVRRTKDGGERGRGGGARSDRRNADDNKAARAKDNASHSTKDMIMTDSVASRQYSSRAVDRDDALNPRSSSIAGNLLRLEDEPYPGDLSPEMQLSTQGIPGFAGIDARQLAPGGDVYTIPEISEEEGGSPLGGDGLSRRRGKGAESSRGRPTETEMGQRGGGGGKEALLVPVCFGDDDRLSHSECSCGF